MSGFENLHYFVIVNGRVNVVESEEFFVSSSFENYVRCGDDYIHRKDYFVLNNLSYEVGKHVDNFKKRISVDLKGRLNEINLEDFGLNLFPMKVLGFDYLDVLKLSLNNIRAIPKQIVNLEKLVGIVVESSNLVEIPDEILKLEKLEYACFQGNILNKKSRRVLERLEDLNVNVFY